MRSECFARTGSGGAGKHRSGLGFDRETTFLAPIALSVLTQYRAQAKYGLSGGERGTPWRQRVMRALVEVVEFVSFDGSDVADGNPVVLETQEPPTLRL